MTPSPNQAEEAVRARQAITGLSRLLEGIAPWLVEVGTWVFGGLMALNLVIIAALITVGRADSAVLVAATAFGAALPLEAAGMILLRLGNDVDDIRLDKLALRSFEQARFPDIRTYFPPPGRRTILHRRRLRVTLGYVLAVAASTGVLTIIGIVSALWHMAPWVGEASLAAVFLSIILVLVAVSHAMPPAPEPE